MNRISFSAQLVCLALTLGLNACSSDGGTGAGNGGQGSGGLKGSSGAGSGGAGSIGSAGRNEGNGGMVSSGGTSALAGGPSAGGNAAGGLTNGSGGSVAGGSASGGTTSSAGGSSGGRAGGAGSGQGGASGGSGGNAGATSTGGSGGFCKASPCVIFPVGDSITLGLNSSDNGGYRSALFKLVVDANQNVTFIGSQSGGPSTVAGKTFPKNHEGWSGITITGITGKVPPTVPFPKTPHIILVHIGTNDMTNKADPTTAAKQLDTLIGNLVQAAPDALVVVAKIVPLGYNDNNYTSYIAKIPDVVKSHASKNEHVVMVDMSTLPTSDIAGNGNVHPTNKGYSDMADLWYGVIKGYLPN
ncbi:MAG TPA: SGNH/GDSL hydrolase family protein [Polyangiaceae bacterium]|nr:SGNH/GDSL hydrolase family protein [Polyangiaceae bacterium]